MEKKGGDSGAWNWTVGKMLHGISNLFFFYLFIVSLVLLGCYPEGLGCFFIPALKVVIFHLFVFRFFFDFREMAFLTKK